MNRPKINKKHEATCPSCHAVDTSDKPKPFRYCKQCKTPFTDVFVEVKPKDKFYYVVSVYSHTDRRLLWKVHSRRITDYQAAEGWMDFCKQQDKNKNHKYFIVSVEDDDINCVGKNILNR